MKIRQITIKKCEYETPRLNRFIYKNIQNRYMLFCWGNCVKNKDKLWTKLINFYTSVNHFWNDMYKERIIIKDLGKKYKIILKLPNIKIEQDKTPYWIKETYTKKPKFHWGREIKGK